ncbi:DUF1430 domain-containing protein [Streptococcus sp. zg-JUN1979]|uniref:DUF1430 domain-containing protein n=1 Tax=Streptococcus sp. zg-JUN1979 TaxID=3391450 RepID=UPI0039A75568
MKRLFIFLSSLFLAMFTIILLRQNSDQLLFSQYEIVDVIGILPNKEIADKAIVNARLETLARETNSVIARRIREPNASLEISFSYATYGEGKLALGLQKASQTSREASDMISSYLIVSGPLEQDELLKMLNSLGYNAVAMPAQSLLSLVIYLIGDEMAIMSLFLSFLTFVALTIIYRIKDLRSAAIKLVNGQSLLNILCFDIKRDSISSLLSFVIIAVGGLLTLFFLGLFYPIMLSLYVILLGAYLLALLFISIALSLIYICGLKGSSLGLVLKGKLPLRSLLSLMLMAQAFAVLLVGWSLQRLTSSYEQLQVTQSAKAHWDKVDDYYSLEYSYSAGFDNQDSLANAFYHFGQEALDEGAIYVYTPLFQSALAGEIQLASPSIYSPEGNTLYVSASYLEKEAISVSSAFLDKMKALSLGEFGLIIPDKLSDRKDELTAIYSDYMASFSKETVYQDSQMTYEVSAMSEVISSGHKRFTYTTNPFVPFYEITDPIIVVTSPKAMGARPNNQLFWSNTLADGLKILGYDRGLGLLKDYNVYHWVSGLTKSTAIYDSRLIEALSRFVVLACGVILGVVTSILLFNSMNLLYFEQFRREIFIKRLSGLSFVAIHGYYLLAQTLLILLAIGALAYLRTSSLVLLSLMLVFMSNMLVILALQHHQQEKLAMTVLKGK